MIVRSRAPLRLGLAGGGTDVSPYCDKYGGFVLNATIDKYAYTILESGNNGDVEFVAADLGLSAKYKQQQHIEFDGTLDLHKAVYNRIIRQFNDNKSLSLKMTTFCEAPAGSGLGSSSTIVVSMIKAFVEYLNLPLGEYDIAHLAYEVERIDAALLGGKQDQYAAAFGGFNFIEFYDNDHVLVNPLRVKNWIVCELESSLVLFYTGQSRESANIIGEQSRNAQQNDAKPVGAMHHLKEAAIHMKESLLKADFSGLADSMNEAWVSKKATAKSITNYKIDEVYEVAMNNGALAGKVSGAGGGGFMMFFVDPVKRVQVVNALDELDGQVMTCHFVDQGAQAWIV